MFRYSVRWIGRGCRAQSLPNVRRCPDVFGHHSTPKGNVLPERTIWPARADSLPQRPEASDPGSGPARFAKLLRIRDARFRRCRKATAYARSPPAAVEFAAADDSVNG
jgi:hypothetical protein